MSQNKVDELIINYFKKIVAQHSLISLLRIYHILRFLLDNHMHNNQQLANNEGEANANHLFIIAHLH